MLVYLFSIGKRAQSCFNNLKKKFMRKKKEFRDANRSDTSTNALEKAEKALQQYRFMEWMSSFIQPRDGRTNIKVSDNKNNTSEPGKDELEKDKDDEEGMSLDEEDTLDNWEQPNQLFSQRKEDEEVCVEDKSVEPDGPSKSKKGKAPIKGTAKDILLEEMEFSMLSRINSRMNECDKRQQNKGKVEKKELDSEYVFCQALAFDLKQLPYYKRLWRNTKCGMFCTNIKCPLWNSKCDHTAIIRIKTNRVCTLH